MSTIGAGRFVDSHCHLNFTDFDPDRDELVASASKAGLVRILIPAVDIETSHSAIQFSSEYQPVYAAVGIHPNSGLGWTAGSIFQLKQLAKAPKVVAIGEIGLDYYRDYCPKDLQRTILAHQLELAGELRLPVLIHFRQAAEDIVRVLTDWQVTLGLKGSPLAHRPGVLHSFSGDLSMARTMTAQNFKLGIGGPVTFKNSKELQEIVAELPLESFLLETDAPFLSPQPLRGKRNEPTNVRIVAEKIAEIKTLPINQVAEVTTQTAFRLFGWGGSH